MKLVLSPYRDCRDTRVSWLGEIPQHWDVVPLKRAAAMNARSLPETTDPALRFRYVDIGTVGTARLLRPPEEVAFAEAPSRARRIIRRGDTLVSTVRTYLRAVYYVGRELDGQVASTGFAVLTPKPGMHPQLMGYLAQSEFFVNQVVVNSIGVAYPAIAEGRLGSLPVPRPSPQEQRAVVRFLDYVDRRVSRFIRAKRRLIALLNEQKQAIIHRAVTRGLDPNVRLKPSGVDWLGDIPEHWDLWRLKFLYREVDERSTSGAEELLSVSHISGVVPRATKNITMFMAESYTGHKTCLPGDLVVNTMWAWMGALGVAKQHGLVSPSYAVYRPIRGSPLEPPYVGYLLRTKAYIAEFVRRSTGIRSSRLRLYPDKLLDVPIAFPPAVEQSAVVHHVEADTAELNRAVERVEREIELLREYRIRLIADVVTGKVNVREAAAKLPDEAAEPEMVAAEAFEESEEAEDADDADELEEFASAAD